MGSLFVVFLAVALVVFPLWAILKILALEKRNRELEQRVGYLERHAPLPVAAPPTPAPVVAAVAAPPEAHVPPLAPIVAPPVIPAPAPAAISPPAVDHPVIPPPSPPRPVHTPVPIRRNWEHFTGAKLFAWIGGITAFLGAVFFIKYSFDRDLVPPALRATIGFAFAVALIVAGLTIPRRRYAVTAQTLCATGVVCLYAVTFACSSLYEFPWFTPVRTFLLMAVITGGAFILAVRLQAQVVAVLGLLGGFLTPVLLSTGRDNTLGLFSYLALLDIGLVALALHQRWLFLVPLSAAGTLVMELGWASKFLTAAKIPSGMLVCVVFCAFFLAAYLIGRRLRRHGPLLLWPAIAMPCVALLFAFAFLGYRSIAAQPELLFGFAFAIDACLLTLAWLDDDSPHVHAIGGFALFALLATWTGSRLTDALLPWALGLYLVHGLIHTTFPLLLQRQRPGRPVSRWSQFFPPLALVLMLIPLVKLDRISFLLWPGVLLLDLMALGLAVITRSMASAVAALVLTLAATLLWVLQAPVELTPDTLPLLVIAGFAVLFFAGGLFLAQQLPGSASTSPLSRGAHVQLPAFAVLAPFLLLMVMIQRLPSASPSGVFGVALLLSLLCATLAVLNYRAPQAEPTAKAKWPSLSGVEWLPACSLGGVALLEYMWDARHRIDAFTHPAFAWLLGFYLLYAVFPFVFRRRFLGTTGPWAIAAMVGVVQFPLVHRLVERIAPNEFMGLVPALFALLPAASFFAVLQTTSPDPRARLNQLAWFGGVALLFLTLVIPIQFERQWITLGWALEGVALLWLYLRVPHVGLRSTGVVLLLVSFVRLALNPAVLEYHARSATPLFNWYLYAYGVVTVCLFAAARLLRLPPQSTGGVAAPVEAAPERVFGISMPALFNSLGTVLAFLLLNLEIADYFSPPGTRVLTFHFSGNFARDMTYTIAWSVFALGLLLIGIWKRTRAARFTALGLLGVAVLKLFLHDLARLGALHRIGALFGVAIVAIVASLAYQRWVPGEDAGSKR